MILKKSLVLISYLHHFNANAKRKWKSANNQNHRNDKDQSRHT